MGGSNVVAQSSVNWTQVLVIGIPAYIAAVGAAVAAIIGSMNRRNLKMSNGSTIAATVERTHELAVDNAAAIDNITPPDETPPTNAPPLPGPS